MSIKLAPSILSFDQSQVRKPVLELMEAGVEWIHFDVMDGQFVPPITFGNGLVKSLRNLGDTPFEAHLMTQTPSAHFASFAEAGCSRILFHPETTSHSHRLAAELRKMGVSPGVAINPGTPVETVIPLLESVDLVLVMTVNPGWGGQSLIRECLDKVRRIRDLHPRVEIEVDGGIEPDTIAAARDAGATIAVVGSYFTRVASIRDGVAELRACAG